MNRIGWSESGRAVIARLVDCYPPKLTAAELLVRGPNTTKVFVHKISIEDGYFIVRQVCTGTIDKRVSLMPPQYKVELMLHDFDDISAWQHAFDTGSLPPLPAKWHSGNCQADCTCPDYVNLRYGPRTPAWWCKHIIAAFYSIASKCDKDPLFVYKLSGHDFEAEEATAQAARRMNTDTNTDTNKKASKKAKVMVDLANCGGCSQDPWILE